MKAVVSKPDLIAGITRTAGALPQRPSSMQALHNILLHFSESEGAIRSTATDLEIAVIVDTPATVQAGGELAVPGKKLLESVREMPDGEISLLVTERNALTLKCGRTRLTLRGTAREDYPAIPTITSEVSLQIDAPVLGEAIRRTVIAASHDEARSFLTGANLIVNAKQTRLVATDGHRLAISDFVLSGHKKAGADKDTDINVIIPARILAEIAGNLPDSGTVELSIGETNVIFTLPAGTYYSRLIAEKFPDYEKIIPKASDRKITIARQSFADALRRVSPFTNQRTQQVLLSIKSDRVIVSAETPEFGEGHDEVDATVTGTPLEISFNARYVLDVLKVLQDDEVMIEMGAKIAPAVFTTAKDAGYSYILMPLRG